MTTIAIYNQEGQKTSDKQLSAQVFAAPINTGLIHQALVRQMANSRYNLAKAKTRAEVRGGGRKPFRQKGTGRARQGTIRAVQFRGGGAAFGPRGERNFSQRMPRKQRLAALFGALSLKMQKHQIFGLEGYTGEIKTKNFVTLMTKLPIDRNLLLVLPEKNVTLEKSSRNLPNVKTILANYLNIADLTKYRTICLVGEADQKINELFLN